MRKFFKILNNTLYYGFVIAVLGVTGAMFMMRTDALGGMELKIVRSGSMEPAIPTGALIAVREAESYQVGDVITFGADTATQIPTTHRIMEIQGEGRTLSYVTQGDANENLDPTPVAASTVIGKVVFDAPKLGYVFDFARQPLGFILLIGLPAGLIILDELMAIFGETKRMWGRRRPEDESTQPSVATARVADTAVIPHRRSQQVVTQATQSNVPHRPVMVGDGVIQLHARKPRTI